MRFTNNVILFLYAYFTQCPNFIGIGVVDGDTGYKHSFFFFLRMVTLLHRRWGLKEIHFFAKSKFCIQCYKLGQSPNRMRFQKVIF